MLPEVECLGHWISVKGLQPLASKVRAITEAQTPTNVFQLKLFLGMLNITAGFCQTLPPS